VGENHDRCFAFARVLAEESVLVAINASPTNRVMHLPVSALNWSDEQIVRNILGKEEYKVSENKIEVHLPAWGGIWLK
jgi:hypothetical protein